MLDALIAVAWLGLRLTGFTSLAFILVLSLRRSWAT